jgi:hypothetical protein
METSTRQQQVERLLAFVPSRGLKATHHSQPTTVERDLEAVKRAARDDIKKLKEAIRLLTTQLDELP